MMALPSTWHLRHQLPVIAGIGNTAFEALKQQVLGRTPGASPATPGPEVRQTLPPRPAALVRDYIRHLGSDPGLYRGVIPPHMWPQWGFAPASQTLKGIPYPLMRVLNGGCRYEVKADLPLGEPLIVRARLESIDDNGQRAVLHQTVVTGTRDVPEALVSHLYAIVPLGRGDNGAGGDAAAKKKERPRVPDGADELAYWRIPADAGLAFALLTGDFNPLHWVRPYARMFGFKSTILHGFATAARAVEGLNRSRFAGDARAIRTFDCKFTKPLTLPARVGLYVDGNQVYVGDAPGGSAYLVGTFETSTATTDARETTDG